MLPHPRFRLNGIGSARLSLVLGVLGSMYESVGRYYLVRRRWSRALEEVSTSNGGIRMATLAPIIASIIPSSFRKFLGNAWIHAGDKRGWKIRHRIVMRARVPFVLIYRRLAVIACGVRVRVTTRTCRVRH